MSPLPLKAAEFLRDISGMSNEHAGIYIKMVCLMWEQNGLTSLSDDAIACYCIGSQIPPVVLAKFFVRDDGRVSAQWIEELRFKRQKVSEMRRELAAKRWGQSDAIACNSIKRKHGLNNHAIASENHAIACNSMVQNGRPSEDTVLNEEITSVSVTLRKDTP